jgi:hypothetical protein
MNKVVVPCEVFSRVTGYFRPISNWNDGKLEEFHERTMFDVNKSLESAKKIEAIAVH